MSVKTIYDSINMQNTRMFHTLEKKLREKCWYNPMLDYAEKSTKINRVYLVLSVSFFLLFGLLLEYGVSLVTNCFGFLYPVYKTLLELENPNSALERKWLTYWLIHAALNFVEDFLFFLSWLPGYWMLKCGFYFWCYAPMETNGSDIIYSYLIQPFFHKNQEVIDNAINQVVRTAHSIYTESDPNMETLLHPHHN